MRVVEARKEEDDTAETFQGYIYRVMQRVVSLKFIRQVKYFLL